LPRRRWSRARQCPVCPGATSRDEEIALRAFLCWFPRPSVERFGAADCVEPQSSAGRVVPLPRVASGRLEFLKSAATPTNRAGEGASCCALRATSSKLVHEDLRPSWGVATCRHKRMKTTYACRRGASSDRWPRCRRIRLVVCIRGVWPRSGCSVTFTAGSIQVWLTKLSQHTGKRQSN